MTLFSVKRWQGLCPIFLFLAVTSPLAAQQPAAAPPQRMSFFVTSEGSGKGADLGGLAGAD
jgi:hypothetical protein